MLSPLDNAFMIRTLNEWMFSVVTFRPRYISFANYLCFVYVL